MGEVGYKDKKEHINFVSVECRERRVLQKETYYFVRWALKTYKSIRRAHCHGTTLGKRHPSFVIKWVIARFESRGHIGCL